MKYSSKKNGLLSAMVFAGTALLAGCNTIEGTVKGVDKDVHAVHQSVSREANRIERDHARAHYKKRMQRNNQRVNNRHTKVVKTVVVKNNTNRSVNDGRTKTTRTEKKVIKSETSS